MVVVDSRRVPRVPRYSGTCHEPHHFRLRGYHPLWPVFPDDSTSGSVGNSPALNRAGPTTPTDPKTHRFGLFRVRSPLLTKSLNCFLFLQVLRWFTSLSLLPKTYEFSFWILHFQRSGFPHSDISGSTPVCGSPKLIAAYHVLHRRPAPRHPPYALSSLTTTFTLLETRVVGYRCPTTKSGSSVVNEPRAQWPAVTIPQGKRHRSSIPQGE